MDTINLIILSLNIGGSTTLGGLTPILELENPDIVMLQEVHCSTQVLTSIVRKYGYLCLCNNNPEDEKTLGTAFVWKKSLPVKNVFSVEICRLQTCEIYDQHLFNIYAPSGQEAKSDRREFFGGIVFNAMRGVTNGTIPILGGDFNCILQDIDSAANQVNKKCQALQDLVNVFNICDAFRQIHPYTVEYTWFRPNYSPSRLDRFYVPQQLVNSIVSVSHHASLSDHCFTKLVLKLTSDNLEKSCFKCTKIYGKIERTRAKIRAKSSK